MPCLSLSELSLLVVLIKTSIALWNPSLSTCASAPMWFHYLSSQFCCNSAVTIEASHTCSLHAPPCLCLCSVSTSCLTNPQSHDSQSPDCLSTDPFLSKQQLFSTKSHSQFHSAHWLPFLPSSHNLSTWTCSFPSGRRALLFLPMVFTQQSEWLFSDIDLMVFQTL